MTAEVPKFYLFLDCDGVLHPIEWQSRLMPPVAGHPNEKPITIGTEAVAVGPPFSRLPILEQAIRPHLDHLSIVISSDWRLNLEHYAELLTAFSRDVRACVVGGTPRNLHGGRPIEINAWLADHGEPRALLIVVDDDLDQPWELLPVGTVFVGVDSETGLTELDGQVIARLLAADQVEKVNRVWPIVTSEEKLAVVEGRSAGGALTEWP